MSEGRQIRVDAKDLRVGDVLSTDGTIITRITFVPSRYGTSVHAEGICHGVAKDFEMSPSMNVRLWQKGES